MTVFMSTKDRTHLFVSPIFIIDSIKQIELLTDFETSEIKIPIVSKRMNENIQTKLFEQFSNKLSNKMNYTIQSLPLNYVQLAWKNRTTFFNDYTIYSNWQEKDFIDNDSLFITINCKTIKKCYSALLRIRQDPNIIMKNIKLMYTVDLNAYQSLTTTINAENQLIEKITIRTKRDLTDDDDEKVVEEEFCDDDATTSRTTRPFIQQADKNENEYDDPDCEEYYDDDEQ